MFIFALALAGATGAAAFALYRHKGRRAATPAPNADETRCFILCETGAASTVRNRIFQIAGVRPITVQRMAVRSSGRDGAVALTVDVQAREEAEIEAFIAQLVTAGGVLTVQSTPKIRRRAPAGTPLARPALA